MWVHERRLALKYEFGTLFHVSTTTPCKEPGLPSTVFVTLGGPWASITSPRYDTLACWHIKGRTIKSSYLQLTSQACFITWQPEGEVR